ncbi:CLUMA_CG019318, isoform A [Clunio marinus]|uniref:CLUMA_CG019318, isoform A n=1 Tax=Clunio marinus TaxID=568069 RepID=A0A1J1J1N3_9DIPT|nr:CLUMA_CG019318, isoform A [Clunio marinus]
MAWSFKILAIMYVRKQVSKKIDKSHLKQQQFASDTTSECHNFGKIFCQKIPSISFSFEPHNKIKQFVSKVKDKILDGKRKNLIYNIDCQCGSCYVGQTSRRLKQRISVHEGGCRNLNRFANAEIINETNLKQQHATSERFGDFVHHQQ